MSTRRKLTSYVLLICAIFTLFCNPVIAYGAEENYGAWAQQDERWTDVAIGSKTVGEIGCLVTSVTKLAIQAGLQDPNTFTPGEMAARLTANGGFSGNLMVWGRAASIAGFNSASQLLKKGTYYAVEENDALLDCIRQGYHLVINVKNGGHWVAVDEARSLATGTIYIMDSSNYQNVGVTLASRYETFTRLAAFTGGAICTDETAQTYSEVEAPVVETTAAEETLVTWEIFIPIETEQETFDAEEETGDPHIGEQLDQAMEAGNLMNEEAEQAHVHEYTCNILKPASYTAKGIAIYICSCGDSYTEAIQKLSVAE